MCRDAYIAECGVSRPSVAFLLARPKMDPWNEESHLGPPSEQLSILQFIEQTKRTGLLDEDKVLGDVITSKWLSVSEHERVAIEGECRSVQYARAMYALRY